MIMQTECDIAQRRSYTCWYAVSHHGPWAPRKDCQNSIRSIINLVSTRVGNKWLIWLVLMMKSVYLVGPFLRELIASGGGKMDDDINLHCLEISPTARRCSASPGTSLAWGYTRPAVGPTGARWRSCRRRNGTTIWKMRRKRGIGISIEIILLLIMLCEDILSQFSHSWELTPATPDCKWTWETVTLLRRKWYEITRPRRVHCVYASSYKRRSVCEL